MAIRLHSFALSGHSHRATLLLSLLNLPYTDVPVDLKSGAHKTPAFLAMNPFGQVPVLEDGETVLFDSNAILVYLAQTYDPARTWYPQEPVAAARVQQWLSVAAGLIAFGPAAARLVTVFGAKLDHDRAKLIAAGVLSVLDGQLASRAFVTGPTPTVADVSLYAYIAHAPEGEVSLEPYPSIRAWLTRIEALPGFVAMPATKTGFAA
ncbi:glutathione S-transferase [Elstera litoralis]|uniref:Glutathione S-transferase n=1 Tax=Elstera litoralis TaxID=552518 RepID=A0A0F3IPW1_9PROT|nr:glutathione S-transferase [Elstera litoralis]KJV08785.1 glutathione S-transferase [Elstera litoralis]